MASKEGQMGSQEHCRVYFFKQRFDVGVYRGLPDGGNADSGPRAGIRHVEGGVTFWPWESWENMQRNGNGMRLIPVPHFGWALEPGSQSQSTPVIFCGVMHFEGKRQAPGCLTEPFSNAARPDTSTRPHANPHDDPSRDEAAATVSFDAGCSSVQ